MTTPAHQTPRLGTPQAFPRPRFPRTALGLILAAGLGAALGAGSGWAVGHHQAAGIQTMARVPAGVHTANPVVADAPALRPSVLGGTTGAPVIQVDPPEALMVAAPASLPSVLGGTTGAPVIQVDPPASAAVAPTAAVHTSHLYLVPSDGEADLLRRALAQQTGWVPSQDAVLTVGAQLSDGELSWLLSVETESRRLRGLPAVAVVDLRPTPSTRVPDLR